MMVEYFWVPRGYYSESKIKEDDVQMVLKTEYDDLEKDRNGFKNDAEKMAEKFRAIQTWYDSEKGYNLPGLEGLREFL